MLKKSRWYLSSFLRKLTLRKVVFFCIRDLSRKLLRHWHPSKLLLSVVSLSFWYCQYKVTCTLCKCNQLCCGLVKGATVAIQGWINFYFMQQNNMPFQMVIKVRCMFCYILQFIQLWTSKVAVLTRPQHSQLHLYNVHVTQQQQYQNEKDSTESINLALYQSRSSLIYKFRILKNTTFLKLIFSRRKRDTILIFLT